ncbi:MAG: amidohydrolase family protein [Bacillota bacterium]|nr:amidohydrolase family protein [Bacillota bacterium]
MLWTGAGVDFDSRVGLEVHDAQGRVVIPGLVDGHVHLTGCAGDEGLTSQTPPLAAPDLVGAGVTTVVGCLGFGRGSESLVNLLMGVRLLRQLGLSAYMYTGSFRFPPPSLMGTAADDIVMVGPVLGVKVAVADPYCSHPSERALARLASEAYAAGLQAGKRGHLHVHVGLLGGGFAVLARVRERSGVPCGQLVPTHCNWSLELVEEAAAYARSGGTVDMSTVLAQERGSLTSVRASRAVLSLLERGVPVERITMSSDGNVGMPLRCEDGEQVGLYLERVASLWEEVVELVRQGVKLSLAVRLVTENPARVLGLYPRKGCLEPGADADLILLEEDLSFHKVFARGVLVYDAGRTFLPARLRV